LLDAYPCATLIAHRRVELPDEIEAILRLARRGDGKLHQKAAVITLSFSGRWRQIKQTEHPTYSPDVQKQSCSWITMLKA